VCGVVRKEGNSGGGGEQRGEGASRSHHIGHVPCHHHNEIAVSSLDGLTCDWVGETEVEVCCCEL
jgi:hypothetical protein